MDKTQFTVVLQNAGYICDMKDGIPTVHTDNKKIIKDIRNLAKEQGYDSSFGIIFDGAVVLPDENTGGADTGETLSVEVEKEPVTGLSKADAILPITASENVEADAKSYDNISSEPSLFDLFADFE